MLKSGAPLSVQFLTFLFLNIRSHPQHFFFLYFFVMECRKEFKLANGRICLTTFTSLSIITFILWIFLIFIYIHILLLQSLIVSGDVRARTHISIYTHTFMYIDLECYCIFIDSDKYCCFIIFIVLTFCMDFETPTNCLMECHKKK